MRMNLVFVSALLFGACPALAKTIDQSQSVGLTDVGTSFIVPVEFNQFDPTLGVLTEITLSLKASFSGTVGVENLSGSPDVATGIIAGSVTVSTTGDTFSVEVFPSAAGLQHDLAPYDGVLDYSGASGATDTVAGSDSSASGSAPPPAAALQLFIGTGQIFLSLGASTFPIVQGLETELATETANASATVELTYDYTPAQSVPEPRTLALGMIGVAGLLGMRRWRASRGRASAPAREPSASGAA